MRDIKFKGKRVDNGEWVYGYYWLDCVNGTHKITVSNMGADNFRCFKVIYDTVSQYVGLKDKNSKEIFENDIIKSSNNTIGQVYFDETSLQYLYKNREGGFRFYNGQIEDEMPIYREYKVVGNVFDNSELLEVSDEAE
jgi:uncharacterized phage protein (TIGR01671 family)